MDDAKHEISLEYYTFRDFKKGFLVSNDPLGIASYANIPERHMAFVECPFVTDEEFVMLTLARVDGVVAGRGMAFPTLFKAGDEIMAGSGGSSLFVAERYRDLDVAIDIRTSYPNRKRSNADISADFSKDGIGVSRALRHNIFSLKKMMLPLNAQFVLENVGFKGGILKIATILGNVVLRPMIRLLNCFGYRRLKHYNVTELTSIPEWVDDISLNDGHKYMEVHDHRWFQWCLDNMFHSKPQNKNHFYSVTKGGKPVGFFMTKERLAGIRTRNISPMLIGSMMEWGYERESGLCEFDLIKLAIQTFPKGTDLIQIASDDENTIHKTKRLGFVRHGNHFIAHKDVSKRFKEAKDQTLWRLRFGYADSVMN